MLWNELLLSLSDIFGIYFANQCGYSVLGLILIFNINFLDFEYSHWHQFVSFLRYSVIWWLSMFCLIWNTYSHTIEDILLHHIILALFLYCDLVIIYPENSSLNIWIKEYFRIRDVLSIVQYIQCPTYNLYNLNELNLVYYNVGWIVQIHFQENSSMYVCMCIM